MELAYKLLTVEEFLDCCPNDQRHYQLIDGVIAAMAPPAIPHQIIAANLMAEIVPAVRRNRPGCSTRSQAGIAPQGALGRNHFETDITVTCEAGGYRGIAAEPVLIVEIQLPSTERDDHFVKLPEYQAIPSLQEILYIESQQIAATVYRRAGAQWQAIELGGDARLRLDTIGLDVALAEIYLGVPGLPSA
ncbi:MAG TPA: Uma2 family endonuclease [Stellaceae bacterium]|jgi:Uma2 family endonuclease|nr:Uma2 family endonuclease [Stellaceae bacterium]